MITSVGKLKPGSMASPVGEPEVLLRCHGVQNKREFTQRWTVYRQELVALGRAHKARAELRQSAL
jgi:hypothetical protein